MLIRPCNDDDFGTIIGWFPNEAAIIQWGGTELTFPLDVAQLTRMLEESRLTPPIRQLWSGELDNTVVAHAQVAFDRRHGVARLARVCIHPEFRGRGLATPFLRQIIHMTFDDRAIERLELNVYTFNDPAIRTYKNLGFIEEGVRRSSVRVGGERWDTAIYGMLRGEHKDTEPGKRQRGKEI